MLSHLQALVRLGPMPPPSLYPKPRSHERIPALFDRRHFSRASKPRENAPSLQIQQKQTGDGVTKLAKLIADQLLLTLCNSL